MEGEDERGIRESGKYPKHKKRTNNFVKQKTRKRREAAARKREKEKEKQRKKLTKKCMIENNNLYKTSADAYNPQLDW